MDLAKKIDGTAGKLKAAASGTFMAGKENLLVSLTYLLQIIPIVGLVVAIAVYLLRKDEPVRFHAIQAFIASAFFTFLALILAALNLPALLLSLLSLAVLAVFAFAALKAYKKEKVVFPLVDSVTK